MNKKSFQSGSVAILFIILFAVAAFAAWYFNSPTFKNLGIDLDSQVATGWTAFTKPTATEGRIIYVSNSQGNDTNNGSTEALAVKSLSKGISLLLANRTAQSNGTFGGKPDWLLLRKGDTWTNQNLGNWKLSGQSESRPVLISSYCPAGGSNCTARPIINSGSENGWYSARQPGSNFLNNVAIVGIEFRGTGDGGIRRLTPGQNMLIEDVKIDGYYNNISMSIQDGALSNLKIRRSVIIDSGPMDGGTDNMTYFSEVKGVTLEENIIDKSGSRTNLARPSLPGHDIYMQSSVSNAIIRGNIIAFASSHGVQARGGGTITNNLFLYNPISLLVGKGAYVTPGGVVGEVANNIFLEGDDMPSKPAVGSWGMEVGNTKPNGNTRIYGNIISNSKSITGLDSAFSLDSNYEGVDNPADVVGANSITIENNIVYNWSSGMSISRYMEVGPLGTPGTKDRLSKFTVKNNNFINTNSDIVMRHGPTYNGSYESFSGNNYYRPGAMKLTYILTEGNLSTWKSKIESTATSIPRSYKDPSRTIETYHASIGKSANATSFIQETWKQSKDNWRSQYTADAVNTYIRDGFNITSVVEPPPPPPPPTTSPVVSDIVLYNADTDKIIQNISDNDTIIVPTGTNLAIVAATTNTNSVRFVGNGTTYPIESTAPFAMTGDATGNLNPWAYTVGIQITITTTPYPETNGGGPAGDVKTVNFTITNGTSSALTITNFALYNAVTNTKIKNIVDNEKITKSLLPGAPTQLTVVAETSSGVQSVKFYFTANAVAQPIKIESLEPYYAIAGKNSANVLDVLPWNYTPGATYEVTATPYPKDSAGGTAGTSKTIRFVIQ